MTSRNSHQAPNQNSASQLTIRETEIHNAFARGIKQGRKQGRRQGFFACALTIAVGLLCYQIWGSKYGAIIAALGNVPKISSSPEQPREVPSPSPQKSPSSPVEDLASKITVRVRSGNSKGSGISIGNEGSSYIVLTNGHVLSEGDSTQIETPDGQSHEAIVLFRYDDNRKQGDDLAVLEFESDRDYAVVSVNTSELQDGEEVYAAGFPYSQQELEFRSGKVTMVLEEPLERGYQVGYLIPIDKGMSGGPLLNSQGELVGINGKHDHPLWDAPYILKSGEELPQPRKELNKYSWAIPSETFVNQAAPSLLGNIALKPSNPRESAPTFRQGGDAKVSSGELAAELYYQETGDTFTDLQLELVIDGKTLVKELPKEPEEKIEDFRLQVRDLDKDGNPEVIVDIIASKKKQYSYSLFYSSVPDAKEEPIERFWGIVDSDPDYIFKEYDPDSILLESFNQKLPPEFRENSPNPVFPLQIWQYSRSEGQPILKDVTYKYRDRLYEHTRWLWQEYQVRRQRGDRDVKGVLAAYLAEKHLLGEGEEGWQYVKDAYQEGDREEYFAKMRAFLTSTGYDRPRR